MDLDFLGETVLLLLSGVPLLAATSRSSRSLAGAVLAVRARADAPLGQSGARSIPRELTSSCFAARRSSCRSS